MAIRPPQRWMPSQLRPAPRDPAGRRGGPAGRWLARLRGGGELARVPGGQEQGPSPEPGQEPGAVPRGRRPRPGPALELAAAAAATALTATLLWLMVRAISFDARSLVAPAIGPLWAAGMLAVALLGYAVPRRYANPVARRLATGSLAGAAAGLATLPMLAGLHGTPQPLNGVLGGDMSFRTEYVTRFASTWHLDDYTFRGLHAFYPPGWFWAAGRSAALLDVTPWRIVKPFTLLTIAVTVLLGYALWRTALGPAASLAAVVGAMLTLNEAAWFQAYSCIVAVAGVAWVAAAGLAVRRGTTRGRGVALVLTGAALALSYYLLFLLMVGAVVTLAVLGPPRRAALRRAATLCGAIAVLTAVFWGPFLYGLLAHGSAAQGHYVNDTFTQLNLGLSLADVPAEAVLVVAAVVVLALSWASPAARAVGVLLAGTVLYRLLSLLTLLVAHQQLQPQRATTMMYAALGAAVPVAVDGLRRATPRRLPMQPRWLRRAGTAAVAAVTLPAVLTIGGTQGAYLASGDFTTAAHGPTGLALSGRIAHLITGTTGRPADRLTIVSNDVGLLVTRPFHGFLPWNARYAHPEARVPERVAVLRRAAACPDSACLTRTLAGTPFGPVDALVLTRVPGGYRAITERDAFPYPVSVQIRFRPGLFAPGDWVSRSVGPYQVLVRRH